MKTGEASRQNKTKTIGDNHQNKATIAFLYFSLCISVPKDRKAES